MNSRSQQNWRKLCQPTWSRTRRARKPDPVQGQNLPLHPRRSTKQTSNSKEHCQRRVLPTPRQQQKTKTYTNSVNRQSRLSSRQKLDTVRGRNFPPHPRQSAKQTSKSKERCQKRVLSRLQLEYRPDQAPLPTASPFVSTFTPPGGVLSVVSRPEDSSSLSYHRHFVRLAYTRAVAARAQSATARKDQF